MRAAALTLLCGVAACAHAAEGEITLWKEIDVEPYMGSFVSPGDLDADGRVDFLLSQMGPHTTPAALIALDHKGGKLWEVGDRAYRARTAGRANEPTCRGIASVFDVDGDGRAEVIAELWERDRPMLVLLDGATGKMKHRIPSPFDMSVRRPKGHASSRPVPMALIAHLDGPDKRPSIVLKYEASNRIPCHVVALGPDLRVRWRLKTRPTGMGHIPTVADLDGDGRDEIVLGQTVLNGDGSVRWQRTFGIHADCTDVADLTDSPGREVLVSICSKGPAYCLAGTDGKTLWQKTRKDVPHGQAIWAGDFMPKRPGQEVVILCSGHVGKFMTVAGDSGKALARFSHLTQVSAYPDFPVKVRWTDPKTHTLWIPVDRRLVDGFGKTVRDLGRFDKQVAERLACGATKKHLAAQAIAIDLCGDGREDLLLYQPYHGRAVFIFTQADSKGAPKPYRHQPNAYNFRTYF